MAYTAALTFSSYICNVNVGTLHSEITGPWTLENALS